MQGLKQTPTLIGEEASPPTIYSLTPNPSPNGEGREYYCLQIKRAFL
ncbi:hypothetical protein HMPREF9969_1532 [Prevotella sp. oral taxon 306 str. F0472]|nr:hypothetical protein HMPREF9969_1532 [Prevotella sp. oral taxon 306 str. F0472]